jgi:hypothetical protein
MHFPALPDPEGVCPFPVTVRDVITNQTAKTYDGRYVKASGRLITEISTRRTARVSSATSRVRVGSISMPMASGTSSSTEPR